MLFGYTGTTPGTLTVQLGAPNPMCAVRQPDVPGDLAMRSTYGYTPVVQGWIPRNAQIARPGACGLGDALGEDPEHDDLRKQLLAEEIKTRRNARLWGMVSSLAAVASVAVSVYAMKSRGRR